MIAQTAQACRHLEGVMFGDSNASLVPPVPQLAGLPWRSEGPSMVALAGYDISPEVFFHRFFP
jgi:hypothetical protein